MEEVPEFNYLGSIMCKHGSMEGETKEIAVQGRDVVGSLWRMMKGRTVSMEVKMGLRDGIIFSTVTYASETWVWSEKQRSKIQVVEMSYLRSACGVRRVDGESNESVCNRFGMSSKGEGMKCGVVEGVKLNTLRWFGHMKKMAENVVTKRIYMSMVDVVETRGRPPVKWEDRALEYVRERGERRMRRLEHARRDCKDRNKWRLFCRGHPLTGGVLRNRHQR